MYTFQCIDQINDYMMIYVYIYILHIIHTFPWDILVTSSRRGSSFQVASTTSMGYKLPSQALSAARDNSRRAHGFVQLGVVWVAGSCGELVLSENVVYPIVPNGFADHYPY